jgi:hypothetical protein
MNDILIIDDVVCPLYQDKIEEFLLVSNNPWFFQSDITLSDDYLNQLDRENPTNKLKRRPGFGSLMFDLHDQKGQEYHFLAPIMYAASEKSQIPINKLTLIRGFLSLPVSKSKIDKPHIDIPEPHYVGLYYVNDSDGDTVIYQETYNPMFESTIHAELTSESLSVVRTITPKKGRLVIFNGNHYHSSSQPTTTHRCVINFHFL